MFSVHVIPCHLLVDLIWFSLELQVVLSDRVSCDFVSCSYRNLLSIVHRALDTLLNPPFCAFCLNLELFPGECSVGLRSARLVSAGLGPRRHLSTSSRTTLMSATGACMKLHVRANKTNRHPYAPCPTRPPCFCCNADGRGISSTFTKGSHLSVGCYVTALHIPGPVSPASFLYPGP